jgi:gliding motility-associated lipoprotein GldH
MRRLLVVFLLFGLISCGKDVIINEYKNMPDYGWEQRNKAVFEFESTDTTHYTNFAINLRVSGDYPFSNMYVVSHLIGPDSSVHSQRTNLILAADDGKWLGSGMGDMQSYQIQIMENRALRIPGKYTIELEQYMRMDTLPAVKDVGIRVTKGEEIF